MLRGKYNRKQCFYEDWDKLQIDSMSAIFNKEVCILNIRLEEIHFILYNFNLYLTIIRLKKKKTQQRSSLPHEEEKGTEAGA